MEFGIATFSQMTNSLVMVEIPLAHQEGAERQPGGREREKVRTSSHSQTTSKQCTPPPSPWRCAPLLPDSPRQKSTTQWRVRRASSGVHASLAPQMSVKIRKKRKYQDGERKPQDELEEIKLQDNKLEEEKQR
ncbi:hypothetical protein CEXT_270501 [Caerostris extrusa]|uniref:Uncharacterized protein n=1 Tax=Caerostris extrusa TaxID=172846 RepID=A0AAV4XPY0_CAEEX|nr:hypothetical protein CEXT_270501 [Caerostris extrusa]